MNDDDVANPLRAVDLQTWHVPPPVEIDRDALLARALTPATAPVRRMRAGWMIAAIVLVNALVTTVLVLVLSRSPAPAAAPAPAGRDTDARVRELRQRLDDERRELERRLAEIDELNALITELTEKVRRYEQRDRTVTRPRDPVPARPAPGPSKTRSFDHARPGVASGDCDEVYCVLTNYQGSCCAAFRAAHGAPTPRTPTTSTTPKTPMTLARAAITNGIATVKSEIRACGTLTPARGTVKVRVRVASSGVVTNVEVAATPDPVLGACVARTVARAVFAQTEEGAAFSYPFVF